MSDVTKGKVHFGLANGVGIVAYKTFRFGIDVGYDLYRQEQDASGTISRNGLFASSNYGRPSLSFLFTLSFQTKEPAKKAQSEPE